MFEDSQSATQVLSTLSYNTLSAIRGESGVAVNKVEHIGPDTPFYIDVRGPVTLGAVSGLQMSTDGETWTDTTETTLSGGKTYFRVASDSSSPLNPSWTEDANSDYDIGGNINSLAKVNFENDTTCYIYEAVFAEKQYLKSAGNLILPATTLTDGCYVYMFAGCTSLTTAPMLPATTLADGCYNGMFEGCTSLTKAPELPATTLAYSCYSGMFTDCESLTTAPALPATTLTESCYSSMFNGCTSLATAPALPATTLADGCYGFMFNGCTSLATAPELPATTLARSCYDNIFHNCTSLTTAPTLPATALADYCYYGMFTACTHLITAPELPATTLTPNCYNSMFNGCTSLNYIKCLATDISASSCLESWVASVSSTGTFVKAPSMTNWTTGISGIPTGWTTQDAA